MDDSTTQDLKPFTFKLDLHLKTGVSKGKGSIDPFPLHISKKLPHKAIHGLLKVLQNDLVSLPFAKKLHSFHLVKHGVMTPINRVSSVHIPKHTKPIKPFLHQRDLVH